MESLRTTRGCPIRRRRRPVRRRHRRGPPRLRTRRRPRLRLFPRRSRPVLHLAGRVGYGHPRVQLPPHTCPITVAASAKPPRVGARCAGTGAGAATPRAQPGLLPQWAEHMEQSSVSYFHPAIVGQTSLDSVNGRRPKALEHAGASGNPGIPGRILPAHRALWLGVGTPSTSLLTAYRGTEATGASDCP